MAPSAIDDQRRKEDLELLALFDTDGQPDLSSYQSIYGFSSITIESALSNSTECTANNEDENVDVTSWIQSIDYNTFAYIDEIIAADAASRSPASRSSASRSPASRSSASRSPAYRSPASTSPESSSCDVKDATFSFPRKYKCPMCSKEFLNKSAMEKHGRRHILRQIKCPCGFRGQSPVQKHKHYLYHHVGMPKQKFLASF